jgi:Na+/H+ antiporter NhaD/arsenite permease-like protein
MNPLLIGLIITCCLVIIFFVKKDDNIISALKKLSWGVLIFFILFGIYIFVIIRAWNGAKGTSM